MEQALQDRPAKFGLIGFILGVVSIVVILLQLSAFLEPQEKSSGAVIGEIAADIRQAATRALSGEPAPAPPPANPRLDYYQLITVAALCAAGLAVGLGAVGLYRKEPSQLSFMAVGVGISALVMFFIFWMALLICGMILLISIIRNIDGILG